MFAILFNRQLLLLQKNLEFLIRKTYDWFARSTSRQLSYKMLYNTITEKFYTAQLPYKMCKNDINYAYICFSIPILEDLNRVNKNFESNSADLTKLLNDLMILLNSAVQKITTPNSK